MLERSIHPPRALLLALACLAAATVLAPSHVNAQEARIDAVASQVEAKAETDLAVGGQPFFPLGVYMAGSNDAAHLDQVRKGGLNTLIDYQWGLWGYNAAQGIHPEAQQYLNRVDAAGLKVMFNLAGALAPAAPASFCQPWFCDTPGACDPGATELTLIQEHVNAFKSHPAVLGWYMADEPGHLCNQISPARLQAVQNLIHSLSAKPTLQVHLLDNSQSIDWLATQLQPYETTTDILATDPYPINPYEERVYGFPFTLDMPSKWVEVTRRVAELPPGAKKDHWVVVQTQGGVDYGEPAEAREPTFEEVRNMAFQGVIGGAKGLVFYSHFDCFWGASNPKPPQGQPGTPSEALFTPCFGNIQTVASEIGTMVPALLGGQVVGLPVLTPSPEIEPGRPVLRWRAVQLGSEIWLMVANVSETLSGSALLRLPVADWRSLTLQTGVANARVFGIDEYNKKVSLSLGPQESALLVISRDPAQPPNRVRIPLSVTSQRGDRWTQEGLTMRTAWNNWLEYRVRTPYAGTWKLRVSAQQSAGAVLPAGYAFRVAVDVDGQYRGEVSIPGATTPREGLLPVTLDAGWRTLRLRWINDTYDPANGIDANIHLGAASITDQ